MDDASEIKSTWIIMGGLAIITLIFTTGMVLIFG